MFRYIGGKIRHHKLYGIVRFREGGGNDIVRFREGAEAKFRGGAEARFRRGAEVYCKCFVVSIPSCLTTHEGQEGRDTLMVVTQLGSGNYKTINVSFDVRIS